MLLYFLGVSAHPAQISQTFFVQEIENSSKKYKHIVATKT